MSEYLNITAYSIIYLLAVIAIFIYIIKNRLDILCVGLVCYIVYTMYCFFGYGISGFYRPHLSATLYYLVYMQLLLITAFLIVVRYKDKTKFLQNTGNDETSDRAPVSENKILTKAFYFYTGIIVLFALYNVILVGITGFAEGKANVWEESNILYIISLYGAYPSFAYGIHMKKKLIWIPSLLVELTIFFAGSRAFFAKLIVIWLCELGTVFWKKKKGNMKIYLLGAGAIVFLLFYRMLDQAIMNGDISNVLHLLVDPDAWMESLEFNEPRVIIANYDYVVTSGVRLPLGDIIYRFLDIIPGLTYIIPIPLEYPPYFSDWLMTQVNGSTGVGGTFWGESFAMFGVLGVLLFTILWLLFLKLSNDHLNYHKPYSSFIVALGVYLGWYINRLDFNRVGQSIKVMTLCFLIWGVCYLILGGELRFGKKIKLKFDSKQVINRLTRRLFGREIHFENKIKLNFNQNQVINRIMKRFIKK